MKDEVFVYEKEEAFEHAKSFFIDACGFDLQKLRHQKMFQDALELLHRKKESFQMKVICTQLGKDAYGDNCIAVKGKTIACNGFSRIQKKYVEDIYMCVITAGDWHSQSSTKEQVYMDIWGTAFVEGAKILFEEKCMEHLGAEQYLSDPFGPGYYGIPSEDTKKFASVLDTQKIDVHVKASGIMVPLKSMAAIYLVTNSKSILPPLSCSQCFGRLEGCKLCRKRPFSLLNLFSRYSKRVKVIRTAMVPLKCPSTIAARPSCSVDIYRKMALY